MIKRLFLLGLTVSFLFKFTPASAQVEDISVIVSPIAGYNWFDKRSTVSNGFTYGLQAGFGFGKVVELRGTAERSVNLDQNFSHYKDDIAQVLPGFTLKNRTVNLTRFGGEFKTNIPTRHLAPYLILGTGIQKIERKMDDDENYINKSLYLTGGLGLKINLSKRATINFEGKAYGYNMNPGSMLYDDNGNPLFEDWINSHKTYKMANWNLQAAMQFYLGGRNTDELSDIDKAYLEKYSGGLRKTKVILAPGGGYISFNDKSGYRNAYLLGGTLGVDFTNFVGLRGYYYQATQDGELSLKFDPLRMYGIDFVGNLNVARGIVPYITIGGGHLNAGDDYHGKNIGTPSSPVYQPTPSGYYAKGGAGLIIPLGRNLDLYGAANLLYTLRDEEGKVADLRNADDLLKHSMFNAGLRIKLGKKARAQQVEIPSVEKATIVEQPQQQSQKEIRLVKIDEEIQEAIKDNDSEKVVALMNEKKELQTRDEKKVDSTIRMTPAELESLIDKTLKSIEIKSDTAFETRLDNLDSLIRRISRQKVLVVEQDSNVVHQPSGNNKQSEDTIILRKLSDSTNQTILDEIKNLREELKKQNQEIEKLQQQQNNKTESNQSDSAESNSKNEIENQKKTNEPIAATLPSVFKTKKSELLNQSDKC